MSQNKTLLCLHYNTGCQYWTNVERILNKWRNLELETSDSDTNSDLNLLPTEDLPLGATQTFDPKKLPFDINLIPVKKANDEGSYKDEEKDFIDNFTAKHLAKKLAKENVVIDTLPILLYGSYDGKEFNIDEQINDSKLFTTVKKRGKHGESKKRKHDKSKKENVPTNRFDGLINEEISESSSSLNLTSKASAGAGSKINPNMILSDIDTDSDDDVAVGGKAAVRSGQSYNIDKKDNDDSNETDDNADNNNESDDNDEANNNDDEEDDNDTNTKNTRLMNYIGGCEELTIIDDLIESMLERNITMSLKEFISQGNNFFPEYSETFNEGSLRLLLNLMARHRILKPDESETNSK